MTPSTRRDLIFVNPNWSAFVLMLAFLSVFNSLLALLPLLDDVETILHTVNATISAVIRKDHRVGGEAAIA